MGWDHATWAVLILLGLFLGASLVILWVLVNQLVRVIGEVTGVFAHLVARQQIVRMAETGTERTQVEAVRSMARSWPFGGPKPPVPEGPRTEPEVDGRPPSVTLKSSL